MYVIKFGGSAITDKDKPLVARVDVIERLGEEVKPIYPNMILTHGTGSFGHYLALKYKIFRGFKGTMNERIGIGETKYWVTQLTQMIVRSLLDSEIPTFTFFPSSLGVLDKMQFVKFDYEPLERYLEMGIIPLIPADGPADRSMGATIASGDYIALLMAKHFNAREVIFAMDVDGLIWQGETLWSVTLDELREIYDKMEYGKDATGGIKGKLKYVIKILEEGIHVRFVNLLVPNRLKDLLSGKNPPHTHFKP